MRIVTFTNSLGVEYGFNKILNLVGFDDVTVNHITTSISGQDGEDSDATYLGKRELEIEFDIEAKTALGIEEMKWQIINRLSPKFGAGVLRYRCGKKDVIIKCKPSAPIFSKQSTRLYTVRARFTAHDPYFMDTNPTTIQLKFSEKLLTFPVTFPTMFSQRVNTGIIQNIGDAPTPVIIRFYGGTTDPVFYNHTTGEFIRISGEVPAESVLEINTEFKVKSIRLITGDISENWFSKLDPRSGLWQLNPGSNHVEYEESVSGESGYGEMIYRNRYIGV